METFNLICEIVGLAGGITGVILFADWLVPFRHRRPLGRGRHQPATSCSMPEVTTGRRRLPTARCDDLVALLVGRPANVNLGRGAGALEIATRAPISGTAGLDVSRGMRCEERSETAHELSGAPGFLRPD